MLINLSNHPSENWSRRQKLAAEKKYGKVVDLAFPKINPETSSAQIKNKAGKYLDRCLRLIDKSSGETCAVHVMGESTFTFALVTELKQNNITCVASTTDRNVSETSSSKTSYFAFVRFREY